MQAREVQEIKDVERRHAGSDACKPSLRKEPNLIFVFFRRQREAPLALLKSYLPDPPEVFDQ